MSFNAEKLKVGAALIATAATFALIPTAASAACTPGSGGVSASTAACGPAGARAKVVNGLAVAPAKAPISVRNAIAAANKIEKKPYVWGGGHGQWWDKGYDCSGAVSYALHGGKFLGVPLDSGSLESWGSGGRGRWITVYASGSHVYAVIAGLRWDTSMTPGDGPGWSAQQRSSSGFVARHPAGY